MDRVLIRPWCTFSAKRRVRLPGIRRELRKFCLRPVGTPLQRLARGGARGGGAMPLQLKRTRDMLVSGSYRAPRSPPRDEPTPSTSEGPDLAPEDETVVALEKREDAVVVAETVDPPESPPAALDAVRLDTKNVSNDPTHAWFTHRPGTSPVAFAKANPPTAVCPMRWPWVYARCLGVRLPPAPPACCFAAAGFFHIALSCHTRWHRAHDEMTSSSRRDGIELTTRCGELTTRCGERTARHGEIARRWRRRARGAVARRIFENSSRRARGRGGHVGVFDHRFRSRRVRRRR